MGARLSANGNLGVTAVGAGATTTGLSLSLVGANPGSGRAMLSYTPGSSGSARLDVLDLEGRRVARIADQIEPAGAHSAQWDGRDASGSPCPAGVYFARLTLGPKHAIVRMVRLR